MQSFSTVHSLVSSTHHLNQNTHAHVHSHNLTHTNITDAQYRLSHLNKPFTSYPLSRSHTSAHASLLYFSCSPSMRALMQTVHHQIIDMNHSIVSCTLYFSILYTNPCLIKELLHNITNTQRQLMNIPNIIIAYDFTAGECCMLYCP